MEPSQKTKWYAQHVAGRDQLSARSTEEAIAEVKRDKYLSKAAYGIVKITMEEVWKKNGKEVQPSCCTNDKRLSKRSDIQRT